MVDAVDACAAVAVCGWSCLNACTEIVVAAAVVDAVDVNQESCNE